MRTWRLQSTLWVPHTPQQVFPFFADAQKLELITPPWLSFRILTPTPLEMRVGALIDYRISLRGMPLRWRTRIARWEPDRAFADEQLHGPYAVWHHTHTFTPQDGGTVIGDDVVMRPKGGLLAAVLMKVVSKELERIFEYRAKVMAEMFGGSEDRACVRWIEGGYVTAPVGAP
jgi:ligand-binding SRPBCC domain-containing protein